MPKFHCTGKVDFLVTVPKEVIMHRRKQNKKEGKKEKSDEICVDYVMRVIENTFKNRRFYFCGDDVRPVSVVYNETDISVGQV